MTLEPHHDRRATLALLVVVLAAAVLRINLLDTPLERDEGEYAYVGQRLLAGEAPWAHAGNMKFPGTSVAYALVMLVFGQTVVGIHLGLMLVNAATTVAIFTLGRLLLDARAGVVAAAVWAFLSVSRQFLGSQAHATHFVALAVVVGAALLVKSVATHRLAPTCLAGVCFGIAVVMKQHAVTFAAAALVGTLLGAPRAMRLRHVGALVVGIAAPLVAMLIWLAAAGVMPTFWFWTVTYARVYATDVTWREALTACATVPGFLLMESVLLWGTVAAGSLLALVEGSVRRRLWPIALLLLAGAVATMPGFYFRPHYFVVVLPAVALLAAAGVCAAGRLAGARARVATTALVVVAVGVGVARQADYLFEDDVRSVSRSMYGASPFVEATRIGAWLNEHTTSNDVIGIVGSEPELAFYAQRQLATGFLYIYPLLERHPYTQQMQAEWSAELRRAAPRYLVFVDIDEGWSLSHTVALPFLQALHPWLQANYRPVLRVPIANAGEVDLPALSFPDGAVVDFTRRNSGIVVFERR